MAYGIRRQRRHSGVFRSALPPFAMHLSVASSPSLNGPAVARYGTPFSLLIMSFCGGTVVGGGSGRIYDEEEVFKRQTAYG